MDQIDWNQLGQRSGADVDFGHSFYKVGKIGRRVMKYIKTTKLEHGVVIHYQNSCGNIESHFIEYDTSDKV